MATQKTQNKNLDAGDPGPGTLIEAVLVDGESQQQSNITKLPSKLQMVLPMPVPDSSKGSDEINLAEIPICTLGRTQSPISVIRFERNSVISNQSVSTSFSISGSAEYGLPWGTDQDILMALFALGRAQGWKSRKVHWRSIYEIIKLVGITLSGSRNYDRVRDSLKRWAGVRCTSDQAWRDSKSQKRRSSRGFGIINDYEISEHGGGPGWVLFDEFIYEGIVNGNIKSLDLDQYRSIKTPLGRRLYRYLDQMRWCSRREKWEISSVKLAAAMPLQSIDKKNKQVLTRGLSELVTAEFLRDFKFRHNLDKQDIVTITFKNPLKINGQDSGYDRSIAVASDIAEQLGDTKNLAWHISISRQLQEHDLYSALSQTKDAHRRGEIKLTPAKYYAGIIKSKLAAITH